VLGEYIYLGDQLLAMIRPGEVAYYFHNDHLGTPQALTNDSQAIVWKAAYTSFGGAVPSIQTVENLFRFPGQYYDQETGLHYNYFRYYDPMTGRYVTPDPIGLWGGVNLYSYVKNNPLMFIDRFGLTCTYSQSTGQITCINDQTGQQYYNGTGYSGTGEGRNNPSMQGVPDVGPIPQGVWITGIPYDNPGGTGPNTIPLIPFGLNPCFGTQRDCNTFRIHGDNPQNDASTGCIVLPPNRTQIPPGEIITVVP